MTKPLMSTRGTDGPVPFLDLSRMHAPIRSAVVDAIDVTVGSGDFTNGPSVGRFETAFAQYCGSEHAVGVASGLDALRLGLLAAGLQPGEEVAVPALTFAATFEAVTQAGGHPRVVDISTEDFGLDMESLESALTPWTRFVMPVHLYGQMVDMKRLGEIAKLRDLTVVSDACQAHGAQRDGINASGGAVAAAFSFYPGKNLGAFGDAGALVTDDAEVAARVRALREHGQTAKYHHAFEGWTSRLDTIQADVLLAKLPHLEGWNAQRRTAALAYREQLEGVGDLELPSVPAGSTPVWHLFVIRTADPETLGAFLHDRGIATGRHYPQPPHRSPAYARLNLDAGSFPAAEAVARECLSLPMFPGIRENEISAVCTSIRDFFDG